MENATKALLIAGGIAVAIIILSFGINAYSKLRKQANVVSTELDLKQLQSFNAVFEQYRERTDVTSQELISLFNYKISKSDEFAVYMAVDNSTFTLAGPDSQIEFIKNNRDKTYRCRNIVYTNKQVTGIYFLHN